MTMHWQHLTTAERIATIKSVYEKGDSSRDIGDRIGITRNAVIGMYCRYPQDLLDCPLRRPGRGAGKRPDTPQRVVDVKPRPVAAKRPANQNTATPAFKRPQIAPSISSADLDAMVADWIEKNGAPRRFERGDSTHYYDIQRYLEERGHHLSGGAGDMCRLSGRRVSWASIVAIVDEYRVSEGLQPIRARAA